MENIVSKRTSRLNGIQAWFIWALSVSFTIWLHVTQTGYAIFNPYLQESLNLTIEQIGIAAAVYPCTAAILQLFSGSLMDQFGPRRTILPAIVLAAVGVLLFSRAENYAQIVLSQFLFALGTCFAFVGCGYITSSWFTNKYFGIVFGLAQVMTSFSAAFGQLCFDYLLNESDWREILSSFFIFGVGLFVVSFMFMKVPTAPKKIDFNLSKLFVSISKRSVYVLKQKEVILSSIYGGLVYGFIWALGIVWLPKIVMAHGLSISTANKASSCLWIGLAIGSLVVDKCWRCLKSTRKTLGIFLAIQCVSLLAIVFAEITPYTAIIYSVVFGFGTSSHMLTYTIGKNSVPQEYSGSAISIINAFMFMIGGIFAGIIGWLLSNTGQTLHDYQLVVSIFWVAMIIALISTCFFRDEIIL